MAPKGRRSWDHHLMRTVDIAWGDDGRTVPADLDGPDDAAVGIVLAHGAGAGRAHPFMSGMRDRLAARGHAVLAFDYPYFAEGRRAPDRLPVLVDSHRAAAAFLAERTQAVVLAGKSMGGRVGSHVEGLACPRVFLGYPLVVIGRSEPRDTSHLDALGVPMLFLQGERDRMAPLDLLRPVVGRVGADLVVVPDADHSFKVPKRAGVTPDEILDHLAAVVADWVADTPVG